MVLGVLLITALSFNYLGNTRKDTLDEKDFEKTFKEEDSIEEDSIEEELKEKEPTKVPMFLGSTDNFVKVISNLDTMERIDIVRGTRVKRIGDIIEVQKNLAKKQNLDEDNLEEHNKEHNNQINTVEKDASDEIADKEQNITKTLELAKIEFSDESGNITKAYIEPEFLVKKKEDSVKENVIYARTPTHLYSKDKSNLLHLIDKGNRLEVLGFTDLDSLSGEVKWYKINFQPYDEKGFVRANYFVQNEEEALKDFNENNILDIHAMRGNRFNAGAATELDFFPRQKGDFEDNKMPKEVNALYINSGSINNADAYIEVAKGTRINAFVVDIKDNQTPAFPADAMKRYSPTNYEMAKKHFNTTEQYANGISKLKDAGFYLIGRITVFKDEYYVRDHPNHAITNTSTNKPYLHNNTYWPSPFIRDVWKFNVELAKESVEKFGFNEIQFDYIRFPDRTATAEASGIIDFKNVYEETKSQAIQRFSMYAVDELHELGVYVAGDVFGEAAHEYVTPYGQYWAALSNVFDVISPMAYPDHFSPGDYGFDYPWLYPYDLIHLWSGFAISRQTESPTPAIIRPWIQSHDARRAPSKAYGATEVSEQLRAYYDAGIRNGYMTWWSSSSIAGYMSEREAYKQKY